MSYFFKRALPLAGLASAVLLSGCVSNNVSLYQPNVGTSYHIKKVVKKPLTLGAFHMPSDEDKNAILCRLAGEVYLPNKMTYTQYIRDAFMQSLVQAERYTDAVSKPGEHTLSATFDRVSFNSLSGTWTIKGKVRIDSKEPIVINSVTEFGTSYYAASACKDVANSFSAATQDFVKHTFTNSTVIKQLNAK